MLPIQLLRRMVQVGACAAGLALLASPVHGAPKRSNGSSSCVAAYKDADALAKSGKLREAKDTMLKCTPASCGTNLRRECARRVSELEADIPTIIPIVMNEEGQPVMGIQVSMDGEPLSNKADGRAFAVDPGQHVFSFKSERGVLANYKTMIIQGQRNRTIEITLRDGDSPLAKSNVPLAPAPSGAVTKAALVRGQDSGEVQMVSEQADSGGRRVSTATYLLASAAVLGGAGYLVTTYLGNRDNRRLDECRPSCPTADVERVRYLYNGGRLSLGLGAAALVGATWAFFTSPKASSVEVSSLGSGYRLDVAPTAAGGFAALSGTF